MHEVDLSDISSMGFSVAGLPLSCFVWSLRIYVRRGTGQLYFEKGIVISPDPCVVQITGVKLF